MNFPFPHKLQAMIMTLVLLTAGLVTPFAAAAQDSKAQPKPRTIIKSTMHVDVREIGEMLELLDIEYAVRPDQNTIMVRAFQNEMDTAIAVIDAIDVPRPSFDIRVFVLAASKQEEGNQGVPEGLRTAVDHLRGVFGYSGFELLDSVFLQVMEGRPGKIVGGVHLGGSTERTGYHFQFEKAHLVPEEGRHRIRLDGLSFALKGIGAGNFRAQLRTDIEVREGQKAVIGSSTPEGLGETLILIVEASVVE